jgi:NAD+ synthase
MTVDYFDVQDSVNWIRGKFNQTKMETAVIGISGGIDSAVVASLCVRALGGSRVFGLLLPCNSSQQSLDDGLLLVNHLGIKHQVRNLTYAYNAFCISDLADNPNNVALGNIKARLRMTALYDAAFKTKGLVVGTTNKTEASIGYATKYGDHGVDIEPIQDFWKTEIFDMARVLKIPDQIINKKPTADLWNGQTDEEEIGLTYVEIDSILKHILEDGPYPGATIENYDKVLNMMCVSEHKRKLPPFYMR